MVFSVINTLQDKMENEKKILHINCAYMGTSLHENIIKYFNKRIGINYVFCPRYDVPTKQDGNVVISNCFKKNDRFFFYYKQKKIIQAAQKHFDMGIFDALHAYTVFTDGNCAMQLSKKYNIPYVVAVRDTDVNYFFKYRLPLRRKGIEILRNASAIYFLSEKYKEQVIGKYVPSKEKENLSKKTFVVPNAIDDFWFENVPEEIKECKLEECIDIIFVGRIIKRKNPLKIVEAARILIDKGYNVRVTVVGRPEDTKIYNKLVENEFVMHIPYCSKEELISIYRNNDVFVMPSLTETFGLTYAEAMSQGLPVVYTRGQGFDGQFADGEVGFAVDSGSAKDIAEKVLEICRNHGEISGRCVVCAQKFKWDNIINEYEKYYKE